MPVSAYYEFTLTSSLYTLVHAQIPTETHADGTDSYQSMHQAELHNFSNIGNTAQTPRAHVCSCAAMLLSGHRDTSNSHTHNCSTLTSAYAPPHLH